MNELLGAIGIYLDFFEREVIAFILTLPRVYLFVTVSQIMGLQAVPRLVRNVVVLVLAGFATPVNLAHFDAFGGTVLSYAGYFAKECAIGILLGYIIGWIFWAVQAAGTLIDNQRGAAIASSIDPLHGHETTPLGTLFAQAFLTYAFVTGAILHLILLLYQSYVIWPAGRMIPIPPEGFPALMLAVADNGMRLMAIIAAPIVAIMFLAEFALALVSRFAPQVQVFILAMPIKSALAVLILIFYFSRFLPFAAGELGEVWPEIGQLFNLFNRPVTP
jgi:type III secretion protein T